MSAFVIIWAIRCSQFSTCVKYQAHSNVSQQWHISEARINDPVGTSKVGFCEEIREHAYRGRAKGEFHHFCLRNNFNILATPGSFPNGLQGVDRLSVLFSFRGIQGVG